VIVDLRPTQALHASATKRHIASLLSAGLGVGGQTLPPKKRPNGKPLGGELPGLILQAPVVATQAGWSIEFKDPARPFHEGLGKNRPPPRPIIGLTAAERQTQVAGLARVAAKQITARLMRGS
jgi:hypothetical protein